MAEIITLDKKPVIETEKVFYIIVGRIGHFNLYLKVVGGKFGKIDLGATNNIADAKQFTDKKTAEDFIKLSSAFKKCEIVEYDYINFADGN